MDPVKVLIVEDEGIVALVIRNKLLSLGYEVVDTVSKGEDAVRIAGEESPHVVLMDIKLQGNMDGIAAAEQIRKLYSIPVIYLTSYSNKVVMERAKITEPYGYILKPFQERELHIAIKMALYRHQAESALRESEEKYRLLFEKSPVPLFVLEAGSRTILAANETCVRHYGYSEDELLGMNFDEICPSSGNEPPFYGRWVHRVKDGSEIYVDVSSHRIRFMGKEAVLVHSRDITERVRAEVMLAQRQAALQAVYRLATTSGRTFDSICGHAAATLSSLLKANGIFLLRIIGRDAHVMADMRGGGTSPDTGPFPASKLFGKAVHEGMVFPADETPILELQEDNPLFEGQGAVSLMAVPMVDTDSRLLGCIVVFGDSGREFTAEDVLVVEVFGRYIAHEIVREKLSESLAQAQKMEVIGKLSGGVAHEVRNPLNAIMALTDALARDLGDDPEHREFLDHMRQQVERLADLMKDMLELGKPVERLHFSEEGVKALCASVMDLWGQTWISKSSHVSLNFEDEALSESLMCDSKRLQQVFLNLLENAAQHSPEGSEIRFGAVSTGNGSVIFRVSDRGSGLQEDPERIFEPFYSTRRGGTGLGLSIVRHLIEQHDGEVTASNNDLGPGCTVEVRVPLKSYDREGGDQ
jgi:PAS domain S-box-containing protein